MIEEKLLNLAMKYWLQTPDINCAQTTACSLLEHHGYKEESKVLHKAYRVYGGGLSYKLVCGTITGNIGALGFIFTEKGLSKEKIEEIVKEFLLQMEEKFGNLNCGALMKEWYENGDINFDLPGRHEKCTDLVHTSLEITSHLIKKYMR
ncbi:MAG: C-GCAxxG-C-C family protein [Candidatus Lokiarchaeota archaeon]|nr:C-GCAxxG-C-C family protein [Candidatus Lokiarchaeota archaeon]